MDILTNIFETAAAGGSPLAPPNSAGGGGPPFPPATKEVISQSAAEVRQFLEALFPPKLRVYFFPVMRGEIYDRYDGSGELPLSLHRHRLYYQDFLKKEQEFREELLHAPTPLSTTLSSRSFARTIAQLHDFNALGYDIYLCPNPLICGRRSQISVPWVRWLVLESDESPKAEQYGFLERHRAGVQAAVDSGRRSLQMVLRIRDIRNPHCAHNVAELMQRLRRHERQIVELHRFERLVELVAARVRREGLIPDMGVLSNFAGLMRCPGFRHSASGKPARLVYCQGQRLDGGENTTSPHPGGGLGEDSHSLAQTTLITPEKASEPRAPKVAIPPPDTHPGTTMLSDLGFRTTFLDDLATFERLKIEGIPERHQRLLMHQVLFTAARLWGWFGDEPRLRQEWLQIISINPQRIGCSVSEALADMLRHRQQSPDFKFHLPNTKILPPINKREIKLLQKRLQDRGCTDPVSASRIIAQVLYPAIQKCPQACQRGTTAIQSRDLQQVSLEKNYKPAVGWLAVNNILVMTESKYQPGVRSRLYRINVPLILWLLRFRTQDLIWQWTQGESAKASGAAETAAGVEEPEEDWLTEAAVAIARPSA